MHSAAKFLNGHSTWWAASRSCDAELGERVGFLHNAIGAISGPFDNFLALAA
jgi:cystathionine gamma-lyase